MVKEAFLKTMIEVLNYDKTYKNLGVEIKL